MPSKENFGGIDHRAAANGNDRSSSGLNARAVILAIGGVIIALIIIGVALVIHELRSRDLNDERRALGALDLLLVEESERALQSVDLVIVNVAEKLAADNLETPEQFARIESDKLTHDMLLSRIIGIPQLNVVSLVGADGRIVNYSRSYPPPAFHVEDRDYFQFLKSEPSERVFISKPVQGRANNDWTIYLARRVTSSSGKFLGLVIGGIDITYFENLYKTLHLGNGGSVSLWRSDGTLLANYPATMDHGGAALAQAMQFDRPATFEAAASTDAPDRVVATLRSRQFPIAVTVSKPTNQVLTDWNQAVTLMTAGTIVVVIALCLALWLLMRQFNTYKALALAHEERTQAIAEREQAEAQLRQAQKLEAIGQLTGGIAHDFNNLLTAVLGNLELLMKQTESDERLHRWANNAYDAANRGAVLTQRLLVFSRRQPLEPRATDVISLLASMSELLSRTLGENIDVVTDIVPDLWAAYADLNQLDNAILNIAINARDAMDGRGHLIIAARNCAVDAKQKKGSQEIEPGDYVKLAITDTGKGIQPAVLERVFEPFFSTKPIGQGTGLGLSQVYGFVKQTGGHVQIQSEPGRGTTVELYLPRAVPEHIALPAPQAVAEVPRHAGMGTILVVEDDPGVRGYSTETLRDLGFSVREAANARAALETIRNDASIDLVFSDVGLPGMSGSDLVREALALRPELKILLTTGYAQDDVFGRMRGEPGVLLLAKPFGRAELMQKIRILLQAPSQQCA